MDNMNIEGRQAKPFLKWAGGKRWLASSYIHLFPETYERYIEPFVGGGAVFFHLSPSEAVLGDINQELIETYSAIKTNWRKVVEILSRHQKKHSHDYYYRVRSLVPSSKIERAARFIYLNRTCWNGLYRVNLSGEFNVPIGTKTTVISDDDDFESWSKKLRQAKLIQSDFEILVNEAKKNDLLFVDPPYTVTHNFNGFIKYNERLFSWQDQERLFHALCRAKSRGVKIIATNAFHESICLLYSKKFELIEAKRFSGISGDSSYRKSIEEYIILANIG
ncbi:MAG: Dam family site-specific DNA-(adenine-N6)-methyltransferase [Gammaproteobacteria bacterium]|nr:Dam family site-specific DNA-(adenine-N6)-methyltransferase [Gammaproteobacteria bacterium]MCW5582974.1 Dam family site-specific DNA-(adenine-N6)-methyltransferase [Gammaproteobacteria bacterium]